MSFSRFFRFLQKAAAILSSASTPITTHPWPEREETVKNLLEKPLYGEIVKLTGKMETFLGGNRYLFSDETGRIAVRVSLRVFGETSLFRTSRIVIRGDLKQTPSGNPILRARRLHVLHY